MAEVNFKINGSKIMFFPIFLLRIEAAGKRCVNSQRVNASFLFLGQLSRHRQVLYQHSWWELGTWRSKLREKKGRKQCLGELKADKERRQGGGRAGVVRGTKAKGGETRHRWRHCERILKGEKGRGKGLGKLGVGRGKGSAVQPMWKRGG